MAAKLEKLTEEEQTLFNHLIDEYGVLVDAAEAEGLLKESKATLYRKRKKGIGPKFLQDTDNSRVLYPLHEIVHYICSAKEKEDDPVNETAYVSQVKSLRENNDDGGEI